MSHNSGVRSTFTLPSHFVHPPHPPARILLVDDDDDIRALMQAFLREEGYEVFACSNTARALEIAARRPDLDLLLTDLQMPGPSGLDLARAWTETHPGRPVVVVSGSMLCDEDFTLIVERGWRFIPKPFTVPRLLSVLARSLQGRHQAAA